MKDIIIKSTREEKNQQIKQKLVDAMEVIMKNYNYDTVTIRNICKASGVSYGSFYNLFDSKEKFIVYYLTHDFMRFKNNYYDNHKEFDSLSDIDKVKDIFICCSRYNEEKGIDFISGFYSSKNYSLYPSYEENDETYFSFTPLYHEAIEYIVDSIKNNTLPNTCIPEEIAKELCLIFNGVTFNWCISKGKLNMIEILVKTLDVYFQQFNS